MTKEPASLTPWIICAAVLVVYVCFPTRQYFFDGIAFAQTIEDARALDTTLIHPNHLFYEVFGYVVYRIVRALGLQPRALTVLQVANSFLGALCAWLLFHMLRRSLRSLYLSCALTLLFAFSATWWKFATDANAYVASVLFVLTSFCLILPGKRPRPWLLALAFSLAMCFHQLAVIFFPALVLGLFLQAGALETKARIIVIIKFGLAAFVLTFGAYYYCFYLATGTLGFKTLLRWMTSFSPDASFSFNASSNLGYTLRGYARLFFGGRVNLLKGLLNPFVVALIVALVALAALLVWTLIRNLKTLKTRWRRALRSAAAARHSLLLCAAWIAVYTLFLFIWLPQHTFYRLFYLPAIILLAGLLLAGGEALRPPARTYALALVVAVMSLSNFLFLIFPYAHTEKYAPLVLALEMNREWPPGTVVYYAATNSDNSLFRYFNPPTSWRQLSSDKPADLEGELKSVYNAGGTAWLDDSAQASFSATAAGAAWLALHARAESRRELVDRAYRIRFVQVDP
jgi:hypothetical protein